MSENLNFNFPDFTSDSFDFNNTADTSQSTPVRRDDETKGYTCGCPDSDDCRRTVEGYTCESCTPCQLTVDPC